jgi:hypothetical protein
VHILNSGQPLPTPEEKMGRYYTHEQNRAALLFVHIHFIRVNLLGADTSRYKILQRISIQVAVASSFGEHENVSNYLWFYIRRGISRQQFILTVLTINFK